MDLLEDLRRKVTRLGDLPSSGFQAVLKHIEMAEAHFRRAVDESNDDFFNDAVYRANQAYEGALKETWEVLNHRPAKTKRTYELEDELEEGGAITERAKGLLEHYRKEWRNPSSHEHTLFLGEQDAFLAIVSVLGLVSVLVDQVTEKVAAADQAGELPELPVEPDPTMPPSARTRNLVESYFKDSIAFFREDGTPRSGVEMLGRLSAVLRASDPELDLARDKMFEHGLRPDLVISKGDESILLELKHAGPTALSIDAGRDALLRYMRSAGTRVGILVLAPSDANAVMRGVVDVFMTPAEEFYHVTIIYPEGQAGIEDA